MRLIRSEYEVLNGRPVLWLFLREGEKRRIEKRTDFIPYFYIPANEIDILKGIRSDPTIYHSLYGEPVRKVYVTLPSDVPELREKFTHNFEADILYPVRFQIDEIDSLEPCPIKILFIDIETSISGRIPDPLLAGEPIICVTYYCNSIYTTLVYRNDLNPGISSTEFDDSLSEIHYYKTEKQLLEELVQFIRAEEPDVLAGWNISRFDMPYLISRMKRLGIDYQELSPMNSVYLREYELEKGAATVIKGVAVIDLYDAYQHFSQGMEESYKLDFIGKKVVGIGKSESGQDVKRLWLNDIDRLVNYNRVDTQIIIKLDQKMRLIEFLDELRRLCFCNLEDCLTASRMIDSYILRQFHGKTVFPSKEKHEAYEYEGAFVKSWAKGIYNNVVEFDIKSLYPNLLCSFNLSPETISNKECTNAICIDNIYFRTDKTGFLVETVESLFKNRAKYKELMNKELIESDKWKLYYSRQYALKILLNSIYGQCAYPNSRIFSPQIAKTITYLGRQTIQWSKKVLEDMGYKVLYCDTDSLFWQMDDIDYNIIRYVRELINDSYNNFIGQYYGG